MKIQKKQHTGLSCGAATLLCASIELGVGRMPLMPHSLYFNGQALQPTNACEMGIYQITSGVTTGQTPTNSLKDAGYSYPHSIALAARLLGLNARVYLPPGVFSTALGYLYPRCEMLCVGSGVRVIRQTPPPMRHNVRRLRIVGLMKGVVGLHYVLERPDGTFMDPADGKDFPSLEATNDSWLKCYADTGICVELEMSAIDDTIRRQLARDQRNHRGGAREAPF